jgi:hypothetical protein
MPGMTSRIALALLGACALLHVASPAHAGGKKYHFELAAVNAKPDVKAEAASAATPRVEAQVKKAFESHPQLIAKVAGAPDWKTDADRYRRFLAQRGIAAAYFVTVDLTAASEEVVPMDSKPNAQRLVVRVAIHMLGETMPGRTMGFTGEGQATIKQEIGKKLRDRDREFAWDAAAEAAVADALERVFKQLATKAPK